MIAYNIEGYREPDNRPPTLLLRDRKRTLKIQPGFCLPESNKVFILPTLLNKGEIIMKAAVLLLGIFICISVTPVVAATSNFDQSEELLQATALKSNSITALVKDRTYSLQKTLALIDEAKKQLLSVPDESYMIGILDEGKTATECLVTYVSETNAGTHKFYYSGGQWQIGELVSETSLNLQKNIDTIQGIQQKEIEAEAAKVNSYSDNILALFYRDPSSEILEHWFKARLYNNVADTHTGICSTTNFGSGMWTWKGDWKKWNGICPTMTEMDRPYMGIFQDGYFINSGYEVVQTAINWTYWYSKRTGSNGTLIWQDYSDVFYIDGNYNGVSPPHYMWHYDYTVNKDMPAVYTEISLFRLDIFPQPKAKWLLDHDFKDMSGHNIDGTITGAAGWGWYFYDNQSTLTLSGDNNAVNISNVSYFDNMNAFTLAAWIYPTKINRHNTIISKCTPQRDFVMKINSSGKLEAHFHTWASGYQSIVSDEIIPIDQWSHVAASWNSDTLTWKLYINGEHVKTRTLPSNPGWKPAWTGKNMVIGANSWPYYEEFTGGIAHVAVYGQELNESQIWRLFYTPLVSER